MCFSNAPAVDHKTYSCIATTAYDTIAKSEVKKYKNPPLSLVSLVPVAPTIHCVQHALLHLLEKEHINTEDEEYMQALLDAYERTHHERRLTHLFDLSSLFYHQQILNSCDRKSSYFDCSLAPFPSTLSFIFSGSKTPAQ